MTDNTSPGPTCSLAAHAFQERVAWIAALHQKSLRRSHRQGNVLTLTYEAAAIREIEEMVARERECCAFLGFELSHAGDDVLLVIRVPARASENVDALLAPFDGHQRSADAADCCGACDVSAPVVKKAGRAAGAAAATSATAVVACAACCVLPLAFPAVAATAAGGLLAWLGGAHAWMTGLAAIVVIAAWSWVWWQFAKHDVRPAKSTFGLMGVASLALILALAWPQIEPPLMAALASADAAQSEP
jgi:hypothetical protein